MPIETHHADAGQVLASDGPLVMLVWGHSPLERADIDRLWEAMDVAIDHHEIVGLTVVTQHGTPTPTLPVMRHIAEAHLARRSRRIVSVAVMLGLRPFAVAAHRTALAVLRTLGAGSIHIASTIEDAATCLRPVSPKLGEREVLALYKHAANKMIIPPKSR